MKGIPTAEGRINFNDNMVMFLDSVNRRVLNEFTFVVLFRNYFDGLISNALGFYNCIELVVKNYTTQIMEGNEKRTIMEVWIQVQQFRKSHCF